MLCASSHACHTDLSMSALRLAHKCTACDGTSGRRPLAQRTIVSTSCQHVHSDGVRCEIVHLRKNPTGKYTDSEKQGCTGVISFWVLQNLGKNNLLQLFSNSSPDREQSKNRSMLLNESWRCKWNHLHFQMVTIDPVVFAAGANGTPIVFFFFSTGHEPPSNSTLLFCAAFIRS